MRKLTHSVKTLKEEYNSVNRWDIDHELEDESLGKIFIK